MPFSVQLSYEQWLKKVPISPHTHREEKETISEVKALMSFLSSHISFRPCTKDPGFCWLFPRSTLAPKFCSSACNSWVLELAVLCQPFGWLMEHCQDNFMLSPSSPVIPRCGSLGALEFGSTPVPPTIVSFSCLDWILASSFGASRVWSQVSLKSHSSLKAQAQEHFDLHQLWLQATCQGLCRSWQGRV